MNKLQDFEEFYRCFRPTLMRRLSGFHQLPNEVEDIVQETLLAAWINNVHKYESEGLKAGWLLRVAKNKAINVNRKESRMSSVSFVPQETDLNVSQKILEVGQERAERSRKRHNKEVALAYLSLKIENQVAKGSIRSKVARQHYFEGQRTSSIAKNMGMKPNTVLSHLRRFRNEFREDYQNIPATSIQLMELG